MIFFNITSRFKAKGEYKKNFKNAKASYLNRVRWAISMYYFGKGLCFSSFASRIPDLKTSLNLSDAALGTLLFAVPLGQLAIMGFSGKIVTRFGSNLVLLVTTFLYVFSLSNIGLATEPWHLGLALFAFGIFANITNIAVNTQGVYAEKLFKRTIMSSFHGMWSFAGFIGALIGLGMLALKLTPYQHFLLILSIVTLLIGFNYKFLIRAKEIPKAGKKKFFSKPDKSLLMLGVIGFCCMASEGVMFDWSGVYFKDIVKAPGPLVIIGYTSFMIMMATGRFLGDKIILKYGRKLILQISGVLISAGLFTAVLFPYIIPCAFGFMLVGIGVATVVPTLFSIAGKSPNLPPSEAITIVSSVSFLGFLIGPPIIGYIAEAFGLRFSFAFIGVFGILISFMVSKIKLIQETP